MLPLRDRMPTRHVPLVTLLLIGVNVAVFFYELMQGDTLDRFFYTAGLVPCLVTAQCEPLPFALPPLVTVFTAMFMHGGWLHIAGNMLYLWIFGNNVEDALGGLRYLVFYLISGIIASAAQVLIDPASTVVNIGASGAIAGVLGGYLIMYPRARVDTLLFLGVFYQLVALPAILVLGGWFVLQIFSGVASVGAPSSGGGVAFFAHIGGFVAGMLLVNLFRRSDYRPPYGY